MIKIRKADKNDLDIIFYFIEQLAIYEKMEDQIVGNKEMLGHWLFEEVKADVLIASWDNQPVGFALYYTTFSTFLTRPGIHLEDLFVLEDYRGKGIGKSLFIELADITLSQGYGRLEWDCLNWNKPSIDFYLSLGAEVKDEWSCYRLTGDCLSALASAKKSSKI